MLGEALSTVQAFTGRLTHRPLNPVNQATEDRKKGEIDVSKKKKEMREKEKTTENSENFSDITHVPFIYNQTAHNINGYPFCVGSTSCFTVHDTIIFALVSFKMFHQTAKTNCLLTF